MVAIYIDVQEPLDLTIDESYAPFGWWKFGVCCWQYGVNQQTGGSLYDGVVEYINTKHFVTQPKYPNARNFRYMLFGTTFALITMRPSAQNPAPNVFINGTPYNPTTGLNMPPSFD